jgi:methionyl-tRNA formyltransferase
MPAGSAPGTVAVLGKRAVVATGSGTLELVSAQLEGRKAQMALDLINGRVLSEGTLLGT